MGILAVPSLILSKKPEAKELLDKITPYQGWIGVVFCFWGVWGIISCILNLSYLTSFPVYWIIWLLVSIVEAGLGFIMGYSLIAKHVLSKNPTSAEKGEQLLAKLLPLQGTLGLVAIILGVVQIVASIIWKVG
ncbi:hypothetical protein [Dysgonomonas sp. 520]|uniref:hypothetical protein n=1 Tax=Dysgonomonas sp. 520 TaxID=2302931 RepID=UPI001C88558A|nr:hypothetical protein [Dysgonomonas sp. 520]